MRIAVAGILHESNTFARRPTTLEDFTSFSRGEDVTARWSDTHHEIAGFLEELPRQGAEIVPLLMTHAVPAGPVATEAFEAITGELIARLNAASPLDGVLLALHGAMVSETHRDGDGEILRRVRLAIGPDLPLVVTHDFHANVSDRMAALPTASLVYQTNPHVDQRPRGRQAAALLARTVRREVRPVQRLARPPMIWNILHQNTSAEPLQRLMLAAHELECEGRALAANIVAGYPYADVHEMGPSVLVTVDDGEAAAQGLAEALAAQMWECRDQLGIHLPEPAEAVRRASAARRTPAILVEMGDNIGGGSPGDGTAILAEIVRQEAPRAASVIYDPDSAAAAAAAGIGAQLTLEVGGRGEPLAGEPVSIFGRVRSLHDGRFHEPLPRHGGQTDWDQGLTAVVEFGEGSLLVLNSRRTAPMSLHQLLSLGIYPERLQMIVVKAAIAYRAAYEPVAGDIIEVDSPGVTAVNPLRFDYRHVRRPLWPLP